MINYKIISLIILIVIAIYFIADKKIEESSECQTDSDCVKVQTTCCSCNSGGEEKCVAKKEVEYHERQLENCSKDSFCISMYACNIKSCGCINGECIGK